MSMGVRGAHYARFRGFVARAMGWAMSRLSSLSVSFPALKAAVVVRKDR